MIQPLTTPKTTLLAMSTAPEPAVSELEHQRKAFRRAEERSLVSQAQAGSAEAQADLARRLRPVAMRLALALVKKPEDADDLAQESMLKFFASLDRFESSRPLRPWLGSIVRNSARDSFRRAKVRRADSLDHHGVHDIDLAAELKAPEPSPEATVVRRRVKRRLQRSMERLNDKHRQILILRDYEDLAYREIAETLEIPIGTVMSRLHAARRSLRAAVSNQELGV